jgi:hypothetical protein
MLIEVKKTIFPIILASLFFALSIFLNTKFTRPEIVISKQQSAVNFNKSVLAIFSAGLRRMISSTFWVQTLLESDHDHYKNNDLNSWMYHRFKTINHLEPQFLPGYQLGGTYLYVIKDDIQGALDIFEDGHKIFPNDFEINYYIGIINALDLKEYEASLPYLEQIEKHPRTSMVIKSLILKIKSSISGDLNTAYEILLTTYNSLDNEAQKAWYRERIYAIKAELDLACLNSNKKNCNTTDFDGNRYIFKDGVYQTVKKYRTFKIFEKNKDTST